MRGPALTLVLLFGAVAVVAGGLIVLAGRVTTPDEIESGRGASRRSDGGVPATVPDEPGPTETEGPEEPEPIAPVDIPPELAIQGTVKDCDGKPLAKAKLIARKTVPRRTHLEEVAKAKSGPDGAFVIGPIEERVAVDAVADGCFRQRKWAKAGETLEFELGKPGILSGTVTHDVKGTPCAEAFVKLYGPDGNGGEGMTDAGGVYRFPDLPPGRYWLNLMPKDQPSVRIQDIEIKEEEETVRDIVVVAGARVKGKILDSETNQPIADAEVRLRSNEYLHTKSGKDGHYEIDGLGTARSQLIVRARGYLQSYVQVNPRADGEDVEMDVEMRKGGSVRGTVRGPEGEPVAGAKIGHNVWSFRRDDGDHAFSNDDGTFLIEGVPPGRRVLFAEADGYAIGVAEGIQVQSGAEATGVEIRLLAGGGLSGRLTNVDGEPIPEVQVWVWPTVRSRVRIPQPEMIKTKEDGTFLYENLRAGSYGIRVVAEDYQAETRSGLMVTEGAVTPGNDFVLRRGSFIAGKVVSEDGKPLEGAHVRGWPQQQIRSGGWRPINGKTEKDGTFRLEGLEPGTYHINVSKTGFGYASKGGVQTGSGELEFKLEEQGVVRGKVVVGHQGKPAASAKISVYVVHSRGTWVAKTVNVADPKGAFSIRGLSPAKYELEASTAAGLLSSRVPLEIREGEEPPALTITLNPGASISGVVLTPEGLPAKGARVRAIAQTAGGGRPGNVYARVDAQGKFLIRPVRPGDYMLYATHSSWSPAQELVSVSEGSDIDVTINLLTGGTVRLVVQDQDGRGIEGAYVYVRNSAGSSTGPDWNRYRREYNELRRSDPGLQWGEFYRLLTTTDSRGVFERKFLPPDEYTLDVRAQGFKPGKVRALVREGRVTIQMIALEDPPAPKPPTPPR